MHRVLFRVFAQQCKIVGNAKTTAYYLNQRILNEEKMMKQKIRKM